MLTVLTAKRFRNLFGEDGVLVASRLKVLPSTPRQR